MARKFLVNLDLNLNQLLQALAQVLGSDPGSPAEGQFWYNSTTKTFKFRSDTASLVLGRLDQISQPTASVAMNGQTITGVGEPSGAQDAATRNYVDSVAQGLDTKASVRVATTAAGTLASSFENADTVDGVALATNDRILIKNQAAPQENGIYVVAASGAPTRATDMNAWAEVPGAYTFVELGTVNADTGWVATADAGGTLDTTAIAWAQFSSAGVLLAGAGLLKTGDTIDLVAADGSLTINADSATVGNVPLTKGGTGGTTAATARDNLSDVVPATGTAVTSVTSPGVTQKVGALIGNGAATSITITHNLGTKDAVCSVRQASDDVEVECDVDWNTTNTVVLGFTTAPATDALNAVIIG